MLPCTVDRRSARVSLLFIQSVQNGKERVKDVRDVMLLAQIHQHCMCTEAKKPKYRLTLSSFARSTGSRCSRNTVEKTLHLLHREDRCRLWPRSIARKPPLNPSRRYKGPTYYAITMISTTRRLPLRPNTPGRSLSFSAFCKACFGA